MLEFPAGPIPVPLVPLVPLIPVPPIPLIPGPDAGPVGTSGFTTGLGSPVIMGVMSPGFVSDPG